jgi:hypothetical protein
MKKILLLLMLCLFWLGLSAQTSTYINDAFNINVGIPVVWHGDVIFGPNAVVYIEDGAIAYFYGKNMTVNPAAKFVALPGRAQIGTGKIVFKENNPFYPGYPLQQTLNGGYGTINDQDIHDFLRSSHGWVDDLYLLNKNFHLKKVELR